MSVKSKKLVRNWNESTNSIAVYFANRYFGPDAETYWVAYMRGGVFHINDFWFNISDMIDYIENDYSFDEIHDHYYYAADCYLDGKDPIKISAWKKLEYSDKTPKEYIDIDNTD
jgi:hypothetical protein